MFDSLQSFAEIDQEAELFETLLRSLDIEIAMGSRLEDALLQLKANSRKDGGLYAHGNKKQFSDVYRQLAGITHLIRLVVRLPRKELHRFKEHLDLLNSGTPLASMQAPKNDPSSNKTFELFMGMAACRIGATVTMDSPKRSQGDNPDVLFTLEGRTWGLACKSIGGASPLTLHDRIAEGIDQIERSPATLGFVTLSFKDAFDHSSMIPDVGPDEFVAHTDHLPVVRHYNAFVESRYEDLAHASGLDTLRQLFEGKKAIPMLVAYCHTTIAMLLPRSLAPHSTETAEPTSIAFLNVKGVPGLELHPHAEYAMQILHRLSCGLHVAVRPGEGVQQS